MAHRQDSRMIKQKATYEKAKNYYEEALENEKVDMSLCMAMFRKAADLDHGKAQARLACLLWCGNEGVRQDRDEAMKWTNLALRDPSRLTPPMITYLKHFEKLHKEEMRQEALEAVHENFMETIDNIEAEYKQEHSNEIEESGLPQSLQQHHEHLLQETHESNKHRPHPIGHHKPSHHPPPVHHHQPTPVQHKSHPSQPQSRASPPPKTVMQKQGADVKIDALRSELPGKKATPVVARPSPVKKKPVLNHKPHEPIHTLEEEPTDL
jgi:hypothetical protein